VWGSDQAALVEPQGFSRMVRDIHAVTQGMGDGFKRVYNSEIPLRQKLRRVVRS
jgi:N-acetylneuraminate synthase